MNDKPPNPGQKRPPSLIDQALHAADALVSEVQQRMPPELVSQLRAGQRQIDQRISRLQTQLGRSATRAEVDRLARRIDELAAQFDQLARAVGSRASSRPPRRDAPRKGGARPSSADTPGHSRGPRASSPPADKAPRRSTRTSKRPEESDGGAKPRRPPRTRTHKPPESADG